MIRYCRRIVKGYGKEKGRLNIKKRRKKKINIRGSVDENKQ